MECLSSKGESVELSGCSSTASCNRDGEDEGGVNWNVGGESGKAVLTARFKVEGVYGRLICRCGVAGGCRRVCVGVCGEASVRGEGYRVSLGLRVLLYVDGGRENAGDGVEREVGVKRSIGCSRGISWNDEASGARGPGVVCVILSEG